MIVGARGKTNQGDVVGHFRGPGDYKLNKELRKSLTEVRTEQGVSGKAGGWLGWGEEGGGRPSRRMAYQV